MRKIMLFALLATAAVPALAAPGRGGGGMGFGGGSMRSAPSFGGGGMRAPSFGGGAMRAPSFGGGGMRAPSFGGFAERSMRAAPSFDRAIRAERPQPRFEAPFAFRPSGGWGNDNGRLGMSGRVQRPEPMRDWRAQGPRPATGAITGSPSGSWTGAQPGAYPGRAANVGQQWRPDWRSDQRYDWRNYRDSHRSLFSLGSYFDPYGYGYRRFSIGFNLWPSYYGSNYWLNDPWMYRLPPAPPGTRWVRYFNDALLVDMYTGQLVDVIYNFFW